MVSKVELDLLEEIEPPVPEESPVEVVTSVKQGRFRGFLARITKKQIIIASAIVVACSCIAGISLLIFSTGEKPPIENSMALTEVKSINNKIENFDSFMVDLNDGNGNYRVLVCDMVIEMDPDKKVAENKLEIRKKVYDALKDKARYMLTSTTSYIIIKKDVKDELDRKLGGGVREVYFTKFVLL